ncbi:MAG TPA: 2-hydroxyacid dehydrogenase [Nitrososphaerales archaeon]|nr:2-hydroxyacid dehydrogenase [Nitrososphaerales archaeon]
MKKILVVGDLYVPVVTFQAAFSSLIPANSIRFVQLDESNRLSPATESERAIREYSGNPRQLVRELKDEEILAVHAAPVTNEVMDASPNLRLILCARGGPVNIDANAATKRKITIVSAPGRNAEAVADYVLGVILILARNLSKANLFLREGRKFDRSLFESFFGHELGGKTLGLIGYGNVGSRVAKRALAFGMSILVYDPFLPKSKIEAPGIKMVELNELISSSDFVSLHARESPENVNMFGKKQFDLMKKDAYFVNSARGSLLDEDALLEALVTKKIAGAALDVLKKEPVSPDNPLIRMENVFITPHIAGASREVPLRGAEIIAGQIQNYINCEKLEGVINP